MPPPQRNVMVYDARGWSIYSSGVCAWCCQTVRHKQNTISRGCTKGYQIHCRAYSWRAFRQIFVESCCKRLVDWQTCDESAKMCDRGYYLAPNIQLRYTVDCDPFQRMRTWVCYTLHLRAQMHDCTFIRYFSAHLSNLIVRTRFDKCFVGIKG